MLVKKLGKAEDSSKDSAGQTITLDDVILAGLERGLTMDAIRRMQLGQVVDFCIAYNERQERAERLAKAREKKGKKRRAGQSDINAFFG